METRDGTIKLPKKAAKVRNKAPAQLQITAEQLLREAKERELEIIPPPPRQKITDPDELQEYQLRRRKEFENSIRKNRTVAGNWIKYGRWEESQGEIQRARSVFERAIDVDHRNIPLWMQYAELEMRNKQVNHARNIWDRCVSILPRANQFWYKYTYMEEMLGNVAGARQVFERWMEWEPDEQPWLTYIKFEVRYKEIDRARSIYQRFIHCHPEVKNWIRYAKFEERQANISAARQVYEQAVQYFGEDDLSERLLISFAKFEESQREHERSRVVYRYALDNLPKDLTGDVFKHYTVHEKKYGDRPDIENIIVSRRKFEYEEQITANPYNYDAWFDYLRLLEAEAELETVQDAYERAIANVPPEKVKFFWRRYIYLWINYALYEELENKDTERVRAVYKTCLEIIPHKNFTFSKIWILFAKFEIRQKNLTAARKILGTAVGKCPKDKTFREYINLELELREFDRCRVLYGKWLEFSPENCTTWIKFSEMEELLGESDRARAIFELAINQSTLDMPEVLWKAFIDFEVREEELERARHLYERLLEKTQHVKVWLSYAGFEAETGADNSGENARNVYRRGNRELAEGSHDKEERILLLEAWKSFETNSGSDESRQEVANEMPRRVKKRRKIETPDGAEAGWEEYYDYIFPADEASQSNLKLLEMAKKWKKTKASTSSEEDESSSDEDEDEASVTARQESSSRARRSSDDSDSDEPGPSGMTAQKRPRLDNDSNSPLSARREGKIRTGDSDTDISDDSSDDEGDR